MKLFKKANSSFYWYDFTVRGERYRGSTKEANEARAAKIAGLKLAQATEGTDPLPRKAPVLREFSRDFLRWVDEARREEKTEVYYRSGWRLLAETELAGMRLDQRMESQELAAFPGHHQVNARHRNAQRTRNSIACGSKILTSKVGAFSFLTARLKKEGELFR